MKNNFICVVLVLFAMFSSCDKNDVEEADNENIEVKVKVCSVIQPNNKEVNEQGAKLYVYYDFSSFQLAESTYEGQGELIHTGLIIKPAQIYETDASGSCTIVPQYFDKSILILVESQYYENRFMHEYYDILKEPATIKFIFNP